MQYLNHDFFSNFSSGADSGDSEFTTDLWVNEVADIIVLNPQSVVDLMNKVNIKSTIGESDEELVDKILDNITKNDSLNKGISFLIADQNDLTTAKDVGGATDWKAKVEKITAKYKTLLNDVLNSPSQKAKLKSNLMNQISTKAEGTSRNRIIFISETPSTLKSINKKKVMYVIGGILLLVGAGLLYRHYQKGKLLKLQTGGGVPATFTPLPVNNINIPVPVQSSVIQSTPVNISAPVSLPSAPSLPSAAPSQIPIQQSIPM